MRSDSSLVGRLQILKIYLSQAFSTSKLPKSFANETKAPVGVELAVKKIMSTRRNSQQLHQCEQRAPSNNLHTRHPGTLPYKAIFLARMNFLLSREFFIFKAIF